MQTNQSMRSPCFRLFAPLVLLLGGTPAWAAKAKLRARENDARFTKAHQHEQRGKDMFNAFAAMVNAGGRSARDFLKQNRLVIKSLSHNQRSAQLYALVFQKKADKARRDGQRAEAEF